MQAHGKRPGNITETFVECLVFVVNPFHMG